MTDQHTSQPTEQPRTITYAEAVREAMPAMVTSLLTIGLTLAGMAVRSSQPPTA